MNHLTIDNIEREIFALRDAKHAKAMQSTLNTRLNVAGLSKQSRSGLLTSTFKQFSKCNDELDALHLLQDLWESNFFEANLLALELLYISDHLIDSNLWGLLDKWTHSVDNFVLADWLGHVRALILKKSPNLITHMAPWLQNRNALRRRSCIVSLVFISPDNGEKQLLLSEQELNAFLEPVQTDSTPLVRSALQWLQNLEKTTQPTKYSEA